MSNAWPVFGFETDFAGTLHCIPMVVRFKLDQCGIKLSLKQWNRFILEERGQLVKQSCDTPEHVQAYKDYLVSLIEARAKDQATEVVVDFSPAWNDATQVPVRLQDYAVNLGITPPSLEPWLALNTLQRFALFKLTRPGHDNDNFIPAMREFGLLSD